MLDAMSFSDFRCVACGQSLTRLDTAFENNGIEFGAVRCSSCPTAFDVIGGVPFLGHYEPDDFIGLIEIVATSGEPDANSDPLPRALAEPFRRMNALLEEYHLAGDKDRFCAEHKDEMVRADWWSHRYHEWLQVTAIISQFDLHELQLLNVGAGTGADAVRLVDRGAKVTCIDYSPTSTAKGRQVLPEARWIGGFSHVLPFKDETFDVVCANAALHHMRSVPLALREMIRVLRPGGFLFTTGDPIRPDTSSDEHEFEVFNQHQSVLGGVNEGIIPVGQIYDTLATFAADVDISLMADVVEGPELSETSAIEAGKFGDAWVPLKPSNVENLRQCHGSVATLVRKRNSISIDAAIQGKTLVAPGVLASWAREPNAFAQLASIAPNAFIDLPFPGRHQTWFDLLNGWMKPEPPFRSRQAFARGRWLLRQPKGATRLEFDIKSLSNETAYLKVFVNGIEKERSDITSRWRRLKVFMGQNDATRALLVELRIEAKSDDDNFEQLCFVVRNRFCRGNGLKHDFSYACSLLFGRLARRLDA